MSLTPNRKKNVIKRRRKNNSQQITTVILINDYFSVKHQPIIRERFSFVRKFPFPFPFLLTIFDLKMDFDNDKLLSLAQHH